MTFGLYVTYDKVAEEYSPVFQQRNDNVCKRVVHDLLLKSPVAPSDFAIYKVGTFDAETGIVIAIDHAPTCLDCGDLFTEDEKKVPQSELF